ncbi:glycosyltransferase family 2 protein [Paenibacillus polysaccharolyticus]|uniref:glycosyltransferase family 2 protein n=1 Tax=Paenibacillus polysaccharolyticus TaxID=582692 RepID=UPI00280B434A|nr:glycosyltransferase family 2 protein [Paenibacillus polysaccharolyticus]
MKFRKLIRAIAKAIYVVIPLKYQTKKKLGYWIKRNLFKEYSGEGVIDIYSNNYKKIDLKGGAKKVSVIIPNYNYAEYIIERIDSVLLQTYPIYELIIIDDCSKDNSVEVIEKHLRNIKSKEIDVQFIKNQKNSGNVFAQWQKGFELATGDYVWIAEADDSCSPRFLENVMAGFEDKDVVLSYCESLTMNEFNQILMKDLRPWIDIYDTGKWDKSYVNDGKDEIVSTLCINNTIANASSVVFKKKNYNEIFEVSKEFRLAGDWYAYMRIFEEGKVAYCDSSLNYHRMQEKSVTLSIQKKQEFDEICRVQDYALNNYDIPLDVQQRVLERRERERLRFGL